MKFKSNSSSQYCDPQYCDVKTKKTEEKENKTGDMLILQVLEHYLISTLCNDIKKNT